MLRKTLPGHCALVQTQLWGTALKSTGIRWIKKVLCVPISLQDLEFEVDWNESFFYFIHIVSLLWGIDTWKWKPIQTRWICSPPWSRIRRLFPLWSSRQTCGRADERRAELRKPSLLLNVPGRPAQAKDGRCPFLLDAYTQFSVSYHLQPSPLWSSLFTAACVFTHVFQAAPQKASATSPQCGLSA